MGQQLLSRTELSKRAGCTYYRLFLLRDHKKVGAGYRVAVSPAPKR